jgi:hypothetical protein
MHPSELVDRYIALWNEPDAATRRRLVREVWAPGGRQVLEPPEAVRDAATAVGFPPPALEAAGYDELDARVTTAYREFVAPGTFTFRSAGNVAALEGVVKFNWLMVPVGGGEPAGVGLDVLVLAEDGRVAVDHQFIEDLDRSVVPAAPPAALTGRRSGPAPA